MSTQSYSAEKVANWFLAWSQVESEPVTKIKLQKLLYFAQAHHLAEEGVELFPEEIEAWDYGPVVRSIQKTMQSQPTNNLELQEDFDFADFSDKENQFLIKVWNTYAHIDQWDLVGKTHKELPWKQFYNENNYSTIIPKKVMENYYLIREVVAA